jgi:uracil-DNA glycosylase family 4
VVAKVAAINAEIILCRRCPRLVRWREACAKSPPRRFAGARYWAKPLPGFGTGRMFTGDRSGDWLYGALYATGFASQSNSNHRNDGLKLSDCYITAAVRCAPPANKPNNAEFKRCRRYLTRELEILQNLRVIIALGKIAFDSFLAAYQAQGGVVPRPRPKFGHGVTVTLPDELLLICSYHPSQQNTFTGKLTQSMFHGIFERARVAL